MLLGLLSSYNNKWEKFKEISCLCLLFVFRSSFKSRLYEIITLRSWVVRDPCVKFLFEWIKKRSNIYLIILFVYCCKLRLSICYLFKKNVFSFWLLLISFELKNIRVWGNCLGLLSCICPPNFLTRLDSVRNYRECLFFTEIFIVVYLHES